MTPDAARALLVEKRRETVARLRGLDESWADIVESARDANIDDEHDPEGSTVAVARAQVSSLADEGRGRLAAIDAALARVETGTFGVCERCGATIPDGRLEARPTATRCVTCAAAR
ncbi:TraR/DksA family transcriptional regulator [Dermacoccus nishinomiyaensis]|uniref:TraR/DksA family transcriptional regulator n=1 Tax=Dermacoccus nishinomiyaensis TaxID=1274 RepID=UPI001F508F10|nr:TraR/DksA family transcriptional regulator [Dermacoccus nishinomiyaensis]MCI0154909.1 TraR/DksA family transcriptional regulator [Dermacoccus nishinomiyaensis]